MAQFVSDSFEGQSTLPTNSHAGIVMAHRCAVIFSVATALAAGDKLIFGTLPEGYTVDQVQLDTDGVAGLTLNVVQMDSLEAGASKTTLASGVSLATAGQVSPALTLAAARQKGVDKRLYIVGEVTAAGSVAAKTEIGATVTYRYRQVTY